MFLVCESELDIIDDQVLTYFSYLPPRLRLRL